LAERTRNFFDDSIQRLIGQWLRRLGAEGDCSIVLNRSGQKLVASSDSHACLKEVSCQKDRAARALLRCRANDLARASAVGVATIQRAELAAHVQEILSEKCA